MTVELESAPTSRHLRELFVRFRTEVVLERHSLEGGGALAAAKDLNLSYLLEVMRGESSSAS